MIQYKAKGDMLDTNCDALVNPVNCVGVMGKGLALWFMETFPENFIAYRDACRQHLVQLRKIFVFETGRLFNPRYIINFPTKHHWHDKSHIEDISAGLELLVKVIPEYNISSIAIPALGCGLGGLDWAIVKPLMAAAMEKLPDVNIFIYEPIQT